MAFLGRLPDTSIRAKVWERDGKLVAIAGHHIVSAGQIMVFSDIAKDAELTPITIWREAKRFMAELEGAALCTAQTPSSEEFLKRLGWSHVGPSEYGEVYQCQA